MPPRQLSLQFLLPHSLAPFLVREERGWQQRQWSIPRLVLQEVSFSSSSITSRVFVRTLHFSLGGFHDGAPGRPQKVKRDWADNKELFPIRQSAFGSIAPA